MLLYGHGWPQRRFLPAAAAVGMLHVVVFALLRLFHPAFEMVRSSLMILLGFVISLLTLLVIVMVTSKFKQNIKELRVECWKKGYTKGQPELLMLNSCMGDGLKGLAMEFKTP